MANTILITANWHTGALSQQTISRQYDNNHYVVQFVGYPEASEGNELDYYLLVWMSSAPGENPDEIAPIQLASDQWYISNVFTQQTQQIKFQMCALNTAGTFEAHSPIFTGFVRSSLEHDGATQDIDVSTLFDAYREYLNELIIQAGAVVIDSTPTQGSSNAVSSGGVYEALHNTDTTLTQSGQAADAKKTGDEITGLKEELSEVWDGRTVETVGINKLDPSEVKTDTSLNTNTGEEVSNSSYIVTGYIPLNSDKTHIGVSGLNYSLSSRVWLPIFIYCFYESDKSFLSFVKNAPSNSITEIPQGASFVRASILSDYYVNRQLMVQLVNDTSEKSSTFIEYEITTTGENGLTYVNNKVEEIDSRVAGIEDNILDINEIAEQVNGNTNALAELLGTEQTINNLATFANGIIRSSTGEYSGFSIYYYRVATPNITTIPYDIKITIATGFRLYVAYFVNGALDSNGWELSGLVLRKDQQVRLMIARKTENTSETADLTEFCSAVTYQPDMSIGGLKNEIDYATTVIDSLNIGNDYGLTWDWWITCNSVDTFGNAYIGFVNTTGYAGVIRRQPDGTIQYKVLEKLDNDDDHNACATVILDDGRILVIGSYGHTTNNHIVCWRSTKAYSIDDMEKLSFDIPQGDYTYRTCYSQVFKYNGILFDFLRFGSVPTGQSSGTYGYACLVSADNGDTWSVYKVFNNTDAYNAMAQCADDDRYLKVVVAGNPGGGTYTFKGCYIDLSTYIIYDLSDTQIGTMVALDGGSIVDERCANYADMTALIPQTQNGLKGRLFFTGKTTKASTIFLYATAVDTASSDFIYKEYRDGTIIELGHSGIGFGNVHYISGACFGNDVNTVYYSKATTSKADGAHELHKVKVVNNAVESDEIITEASMCILRPLFLGNGELATVVGHYNDQNSDGTYNGSFTAWELKPLFTHA